MIEIKNNNCTDNRIDLNFMPFSIDYQGSAPISTYFHPQFTEQGSLISFFRGRKLTGNSIELLKNVKGFNVIEDDDYVIKPKSSKVSSAAKFSMDDDDDSANEQQPQPVKQQLLNDDDDENVNDSHDTDSNDTERTFHITSKFDSFTIWNVDDLPVDKSHPFLRLDEQYRLSELVSVLIFVIDDKGHNESKIRYIKLIKTLNI